MSEKIARMLLKDGRIIYGTLNEIEFIRKSLFDQPAYPI